MKPEERRRHILATVRSRGMAEVTSVACDLQVSPETVRRDLSALESRGLIRRTYGAAYPLQSAAFETSFADRAGPHAAAKSRIAKAAVRRIESAETIFVDEGHTLEVLAGALPADRPLTVITAAAETATAIVDSPHLTVLLLGGRLKSRTRSTAGSWTCGMLAGFVIDLAFMGTSRISREHGLTTHDPSVADVKAKALEVSRRRVLLGHHSKFGTSTLSRFAEVADFEAIITDTGLPAAEARRYELLGPRVHRV
ncbi:putative DeoR family transcriptional regulator [Actinacidiphila reveromycinica]|uniref:Lactose phosphotransferase system repressor n=1 Tax=Actinacidiphila reveromycinica TaxID=659352 RepID=A0A7U3UWV1_9ACTN|nr:DeoR/GlpR family DNA-binding transcription regulator [Streptomyces sp. SN-593]BBB00323.1 putative DeoR family transcriptional regulator [Streptomyces sp. SN-593]